MVGKGMVGKGKVGKGKKQRGDTGDMGDTQLKRGPSIVLRLSYLWIDRPVRAVFV